MACPVKNEVWDKILCMHCGTCVGMCPNNAISIEKDDGEHELSLDISKCNRCGICARVCPLLHSLSQTSSIAMNPVTGCYIGYSTNRNVRWRSSSGGLVTTLLCYALEKGIIDGALVIRMKQNKPFEPEMILAQTKKEIMDASTSRYQPVPANIGIKEILKKDGKYAIVGLPCHILGFRKAENINEELRKRVHMHFGLFCLHTLSFSGTEFMLKKIGIPKRNVVGLNYRGEGWPGKISIKLKNGGEKNLDFSSTWETIFGSFFFTPIPCLICPDMTARFSDLSFGDAWFSKLRSDKQGWSVVLARSDQGERFLQDARSEGWIRLYRIGKDEFFGGKHKLGMVFKNNTNLSARRALLLNNNSVRYARPHKSMTKTTEPNFMNYLLALIVITNAGASTNSHVQTFLKYVPSWVLRVYALFVYRCRALASQLGRN